MMNKILPIFLLLTLTIGTMAEANVIHLADEITAEHSVDSSVEQEHSECQDNDCHDQEGHCSHHCSGVHNFAQLDHNIKINPIFRTSSKILWSYEKNYQKPVLDPAQRPPSLS